MYRRFFSSIPRKTSLALTFTHHFITIDSGKREEVTKHLVSLKEECKGQGLDLADMNDTIKDAGKAVQEKMKLSGAMEDAQAKGKMQTLSASLKAYYTRLSNLQTEAQSIQAEVDALLKHLWGNESYEAANFSSPPANSSTSASSMDKESAVDGFTVEPPPIAQMVDDINRDAPESPKVEQVDGEVLPSDAPLKSSTSTTEELEVETIEIEVEPEGESATDTTGVDSMKITDITTDLYERGINFSDCLDAKSLRQRYKDVLAGKYAAPVSQQQKQNTSQPTMPRKADTHDYQHQYNGTPNTSESGLAHDPYPNAHRKMVDPMRYVADVKQELCAEKGIDPSSVELWSGKVRLDDKKRLYDYPTVQSYPIEVRQKGDVPQ